MTATNNASSAALAQRLGAVAAVLLPSALSVPLEDPAAEAQRLLSELIARIGNQPRADEVWLLYAAISATLPDSDEVHDAVRALQLMAVDDVTIWLLDRCLGSAIEFGVPDCEVRLVHGAVVVDVTHSAQSVLHTGIQQVVRNTVPRWDAVHDIVPAAWGEESGALRELSPAERARALDWGNHADPALDDRAAADQRELVLPWRSVVVLPEVPGRQACRRLAAMAEHGANRLVVLGHDCIPVISADLLLLEEPSRFVYFLTVIKYSSRVATVSASASAEFAGFASALPTQGLAGPDVGVCRLPVEQLRDRDPLVAAPTEDEPQRPLVLCVGSHEPRKNHLAVLYAAETLWREGLDFELQLIGGSGFGSQLGDRAEVLKGRGRPISVIRKASDAVLAQAYARARFTMFPSLHEGYGLPVAESLAYGTPVITANFGSMAEQIRDGGGLGVDTRDDEAITAAMRRLLTDDELLEKLRAEGANIPARSWDDYARDLWQQLVAPELGYLHGKPGYPHGDSVGAAVGPATS